LGEQGTGSEEYLVTLLRYFEEEIMGEAYFYGLAEQFDKSHEREKLSLLAQVERRAAEAVRPLLEKHGLAPRADSELKPIGEAWIEQRRFANWDALMTDMSVRYRVYVDDFEALEAIAPGEDRQALNVLTEHEVVTIEFAEMEVAGDSDSLAPIRRYLAAGS
jgi:dimethylamine/trimethylamine dehydrogenase